MYVLKLSTFKSNYALCPAQPTVPHQLSNWIDLAGIIFELTFPVVACGKRDKTFCFKKIEKQRLDVMSECLEKRSNEALMETC